MTTDSPAPRSVLFVNNFPGPSLGGGEVHLMHLVRGALDAGWDVTVAAAAGSATAACAREVGAYVAELEYSRSRLPGKPARIRQAALDARAQVIVGTGYLTNILVRQAARELPGIAVVNIAHTEPDAARYEGAGIFALAARRRVDTWSRARVDAYIAVSSAVRNALCANGVPSERVHTIPNGVDAAALRDEAVREPLPGPIALEAADSLVGFVGRLAPVKGAEYFVRMAGQVASQVPRSRFVVVGYGPQEGRLRSIAAAHRLGDRLIFAGHVPSVAPVMAACDALVVPSLSEGFGLVAAEAMALGTPVVATHVGGLPDVVADGETGVLVPPADPVALASAVMHLLRDPAAAERMGEAGVRRVDERFTVERMVAAHIDLFEGLVSA